MMMDNGDQHFQRSFQRQRSKDMNQYQYFAPDAQQKANLSINSHLDYIPSGSTAIYPGEGLVQTTSLYRPRGQLSISQNPMIPNTHLATSFGQNAQPKPFSFGLA